jgi:D-3-phosphoglycerate dehydrogenase
MSTRGHRVVLIGCEIPTDLALERAILRQVGAELEDLRATSVRNALDRLVTADAILTEGTDPIRADVIERLSSVRIVSVMAAGTDAIDVHAAERCGIRVTNVPDYCAGEVADHTALLALAAWRKLAAAQRIARSGNWDIEELRPIPRMLGRTCGLLGYGRIARHVALRMRAFGFEIIAHDPLAASDTTGDSVATMVGFDELLARSDLVSLHVPLTAATERIIDARSLARMGRSTVLVNAGRGGLMDHDAVVEALEGGRLGAVGLDVFEEEPAPRGHALLSTERVVCTPHMGYYSEESLEDLRREAALNVVAALRDGLPEGPVAGGARA